MRTTPVFYRRDGERLIICNVNPGFERVNPWTLNLRAYPVARVQVGREEITCRARLASQEEITRYWPRLVALWPAYEAHYARSAQRALFVLEPTRETFEVLAARRRDQTRQTRQTRRSRSRSSPA